MREYTVKQSSVTWRLTFRDLLSSLPVPGTDAFDELRTLLKPFGMTAEKFSVEAPSIQAQATRLSDVRVVISLFQDSVIVKFNYDALEITIPAVTGDVAESALSVAVLVLPCFEGLEIASTSIESASHLELESKDPQAYLGERIITQDASIAPDAFAINFMPLDDSPVTNCRIVVARSVKYESSVFVDFFGVYPNFDAKALPAFMEQTRSDYRLRLQMIGLLPTRSRQ